MKYNENAMKCDTGTEYKYNEYQYLECAFQYFSCSRVDTQRREAGGRTHRLEWDSDTDLVELMYCFDDDDGGVKSDTLLQNLSQEFSWVEIWWLFRS